MAKAIGSRSYETQLLVDVLKELKADEISHYELLTKTCGADVRSGIGYARLKSARRIVEVECGFLLGVVPGVGIKRLPPDEQAAIATKHIVSLKRTTHKRLKRMALVEYDKLNQQQQQQHNTAASVLGVVAMFTTPKSLERLLGAVQQSASKLAIGDTLSLFNSQRNSK